MKTTMKKCAGFLSILFIALTMVNVNLKANDHTDESGSDEEMVFEDSSGDEAPTMDEAPSEVEGPMDDEM